MTENGTTNANLSISPEVMRMLGRKLYSSHPLPIVVRELLQNSVDACKRRGVNPEIHIKIEVLTGEKTISVTCTDNGEGMTQDVLLNKFLVLGESGKRDSKGGTGGFGIAKAAIMSNPFWSVHTHNMYIDVTRLGKEIKQVKYLDGTEVNVQIDESWYQSTIRDALTMIYFSDVKINLTLVIDNQVIIQDSSAGLTELTVNDYNYSGKRYSIDLVSKFNPANNDRYTDFTGFAAYRLNGLVQFFSTGLGFNDNAIVNLFTKSLPTDNDYPLSMSRENIQTTLRWTIQTKLQNYSENALTTRSKITNASRDENKHIDRGMLGRGKEKMTSDVNYQTDMGDVLRSIENVDLILSFLKSKNADFAEEAAKIERVRELDQRDLEYAMESSYEIASKVMRFAKVENLPAIGKLQTITLYRDDKPSTEEKRILRLWAAILILTANTEDHFGVGITGLESEDAARYTDYYRGHDTVYYLLNTQNIMAENHQMDALIHRLHALACHEVFHYHQSSHNEYFTSGMDDVYVDSIQLILDNMPKLRSIIRNNYS